jgi:hypothetical protein
LGEREGFALEIKLDHRGSDGSSLATLSKSVGRMPRRDVRLPSDPKMSGNRKARYRFPGAGLVLAMVNICR